jgi:putative membrane protein
MNEILTNAMKGAAMGIAEVIPGVSGGTIAFITGIYERILNGIKNINLELINTWRKEGFAAFWKQLDGTFLISLLGGMGLGLIFGIFTITSLLETHPEPLWGFFFGLIIASCIILRKEILYWKLSNYLMLIAGAAIAYAITVISPAEGSTNLVYVFFSAVLAICALILPGISGSFILLLLGMYSIVIPTVKHFLSTFDIADLAIIVTFGAGCITGLLLFSRAVTWLFSKYKFETFAMMIGFMIGSLNKIWPWRNVDKLSIKESGEIQTVSDYSSFLSLDRESYKILKEINVLPSQYELGDPKVPMTIIAVVVGFAIVIFISKYSKIKS